MAIRHSGKLSLKKDNRERETQAERRAWAKGCNTMHLAFSVVQGSAFSGAAQHLVAGRATHWSRRSVSIPTPSLASPVSLQHWSASHCIRFCWLQSPTPHEPLTCIVEVEESVPSGFEVSSRGKEGTYGISLSNYFHYKKIPIFIFPLLKWH